MYRNIFIFVSSVEKDTDKAPVIFVADFWSMNYFITIEKKLCSLYPVEKALLYDGVRCLSLHKKITF